MVIHDTPERLPFVSLGQSEKIEKDVIYVRRGTKSEKATSEEINRIINVIFTNSSLQIHSKNP